jgi:hypothetical protein
MNMDNVEFDREPPTNLTTMVIAFGGWIDAGRAATGALRHLVRDCRAAPLARIDPEEFFVLTQERPEVRLRADGGRDIQWPRSEFFASRPYPSGEAPPAPHPTGRAMFGKAASVLKGLGKTSGGATAARRPA